jgi:UPF0755 protein
MNVERYRPRRRDTARGLAKFFFFNIVFALLAVACLVGFFIWNNASTLADLGPAAEELNPAEQLGLSAYLALNRNVLFTPADTDSTPMLFVVESGETAGTVSAQLAEMGLITNGDVLRFYMRYKGLDDQIEAGNFTLNKAMTIPAIAQALTDAAPNEIRVRVWEGWRMEQVSEAFNIQPNLAYSESEFMKLVGPGGRGLGGYSFLIDIPETASLEGFLFPDTYRFTYQTATAEVVNRMLTRFDEQFTTQMREDAAAAGLNIFDVVILASIVEREGVHDDERPTIASVYLNRLAIGMNLDADPTTQYGIATAANWWPPLNFDPRTVDHIYNTYIYPGLPPGPIANPGLASIRSVIYPAQTNYYYFRAKCDGSHYHNFSVTYEEHLGYGC